MIGQQFSLPVLVPLALDRLEGDALAAGDFFPADLLTNVLRIDASFWHADPGHYRRARGIGTALFPRSVRKPDLRGAKPRRKRRSVLAMSSTWSDGSWKPRGHFSGSSPVRVIV